VRDVARVEDGAEEQTTVARNNGVPSVVLSIRKQSGTNTVAVVDAVNAKLADVKKLLPAGYHVEIVRDTSKVIRTSVHAVKEHLVLGAIVRRHCRPDFPRQLTRHAYLRAGHPDLHHRRVRRHVGAGTHPQTSSASSPSRWRSASSSMMPSSWWKTSSATWRRKSEDSFTASVEGPKEIGMAVLATTLSLLAVFVPVAFLSGIVGMFLKSFGLTMAFAIAVSLLVSFTLTPALSARMFRNGHARALMSGWSIWSIIFYRPVEAFYMVLLRFSMRHRWIIVLGCFGILAAVPTLMKIVQKSFLPPVEEAEFVVNIRTPEGTSLAATDLMAERFARAIRELPGVDGTLLTIGDNDQRTPNLAGIFVRLNDPALREDQQTIMDTRAQRDRTAFPHGMAHHRALCPAFQHGPVQRQRAVFHRRA
jgi:HAE1 family hydrophobic/amphiphilic exporter-1